MHKRYLDQILLHNSFYTIFVVTFKSSLVVILKSYQSAKQENFAVYKATTLVKKMFHEFISPRGNDDQTSMYGVG